MAEHLNQTKPDLSADPMNFMGFPISSDARDAGYQHARAMGLPPLEAVRVVGAVANQLERDEPFKAQKEAMVYLDITGTYRLIAALLAAVCVEYQASRTQQRKEA